MGGFYGSIHCRTEDRQVVIEGVQYVARKLQTRFLVGPPIAGWVSVYPENGGQDERVSKALSKRLSCPLIHVLVHDDDLLAYFYYRDHRLVDQFNSCPDYFGDVSSREARRYRGHPELLADFLAEDRQLAELQELLTQDRSKQPVFAVESLTRFAELLRLPNAVTSYEYLQEGEQDDIQDWSQFIHVPDQSAERAQERAAEDAQQRLKDEGALLVEEFGEGSGAAATFPRCCVAPGGEGFLVFWGDSASHEERPVWLYRSPRFAPPEDTGLRLAATAFQLRASHTGRFLAVGHASGDWFAEVWDLASKDRVAHVPVKRAVEWVGFSPDDKCLITLSDGEFLVTSLDGGTGAQSFSAPRPGRCGVGVHPRGTLVVGDGTGCLTLWDLPSGEYRKRLFLGGKRDLAPLMQLGSALAQRELAKLQSGDWEEDLRKKLRAEVEKMKTQWQRLGAKLPALPGGMDVGKFIESMEQGVEKTIASMKQQMAQAAAPGQPTEPSFAGNVSITCLEISRDGRWVACGTSDGALVFAWDDIVGADETPVPRFTVANTPLTPRKGNVSVTMSGYTQALAFDEADGHLLMADEEGIVRHLDLDRGTTAVLLDPPRRLGIIQLLLSDDRHGLCCVCRPLMDRRQGPPSVQIWNHRLLAERRLRVISPNA